MALSDVIPIQPRIKEQSVSSPKPAGFTAGLDCFTSCLPKVSINTW